VSLQCIDLALTFLSVLHLGDCLLLTPMPWETVTVVQQQTKDTFDGLVRGKVVGKGGEKTTTLFKERDLCPIAFNSH
jgi:hypothetical protein